MDGESYLYGFTTPGQKVQWMRANPRVCVEWDDVKGHDQWSSVVAFGRYEELPDPAAGVPATRLPMRSTFSATEDGEGRERLRAQQLLQEYRTWWQAGYAAYVARKEREGPAPFEPVYYRIHLERLTGYRATPTGPGSS
jgi:nitroimidazol reductase NimA-like FMN-containing flavoprotein (pyridoxamine 5'-phosphate oxidase superfamily)